jgi:GNAT superfamily N-acetyltransferase
MATPKYCNFGLFAAFVGKGLGKFFLQGVINKAWSFNARWIQLNTCSLDHPNALAVYQSQGFKVVRTKEEQRKVLNKDAAVK